jgi:hypothetical protein
MGVRPAAAAALLLLAAAFAGCSGHGASPDPAAPQETPSPPAPTHTATATQAPALAETRLDVDLTLTEAYTATRLIESGNCLALRGGPLDHGTVNATWDAGNPTAETLALLAGAADAPTRQAAMPSPASWTLPALAPDGNGTIVVAVVLPGPGAAYGQAVHATLHLWGPAHLAADPRLRSCV